MKKIFIISIVTIIIFAGGILAVFFNSDYYYSQKLISEIKEENIVAVRQIIKKKPTCINTYPSTTSKWWHSAMNKRVCFPLNEACKTGNLDLIMLLLQNGADPNCNDGSTPLSIIYNQKKDNWYKISLTLIEYGASLDYTTDYSSGKSPVLQDIVKVRSGSTLSGHKPENEEEVTKAFNYALENCDHRNVNWMQVLQHSISNNRIEIVKFLLDKEYCDVNDTSNGMTALMFAARDSTPEMVQLLLDYGADRNYKSTLDGKTAYDYAVQSNNKDIISILKN